MHFSSYWLFRLLIKYPGRNIEIIKLTAKKTPDNRKEAYSPGEFIFIIRTLITKQRQLSSDNSMKNLTMNAKNMYDFIFSATLLKL